MGRRSGDLLEPKCLARGRCELTTALLAKSLRTRLRDATAPAHDALDTAMGALDLAQPADYIRFLHIQLNARIGVEDWCRQHCPDALVPPPQSPAIRKDLAALDCSQAPEPVAFDPPLNAEPLGVCWVIAGSSMGNRAMAADLCRRVDGDWPMHFLGATELPDYFKRLRPLIERSCSETRTQSAIAAANAVFTAFRRSWAMQMPATAS